MDYYSILGVSKNASQDEIKRAYRKLAMQHHPDRGGDAGKLQEINQAYDTLKDPVKRTQYDNPQPQYRFTTSQNPFGPGFEDMFSHFGFNQPQRRQRRNRDVRLSYTLDFIDIFTGRGISLAYKLPSGRQEFIDIKIPAGIKNNDVINFAGYGDDSVTNIPRGNLILNLRVPNHPIWRRDEDNLHMTTSVSVFDLLLGTSIELTTPTNKKISLNIPQGTKPGTTFSIAGHGVPNVNTSRQGNLYIKIDGIIPKITDEQILQQLKDIRNEIN